jgi:hypothetical protein
MIQTTNHTISIKRLVETSWEKAYTKTVANWIWVYIEPIEDTVWIMEWWESAFNVFKMFSDYPIIIWDKLTDECNISYKVKWVRKYTSLFWTHYESIINSTYD